MTLALILAAVAYFTAGLALGGLLVERRALRLIVLSRLGVSVR